MITIRENGANVRKLYAAFNTLLAEDRSYYYAMHAHIRTLASKLRPVVHSYDGGQIATFEVNVAENGVMCRLAEIVAR